MPIVFFQMLFVPFEIRSMLRDIMTISIILLIVLMGLLNTFRMKDIAKKFFSVFLYLGAYLLPITMIPPFFFFLYGL